MHARFRCYSVDMAKRHILAALAASSLAFAVAAAPVKLGPEIPLSPLPELTPAMGSPISASSNGHDFLMVWEDARQSGPDVYAARVNADGKPADPLGRHIALGTKPLVARSGSGYLIVWHTASGLLQSLRVDENATPLASPLWLPALPADRSALLSNGSTFLFVGPRMAMLLDSDGGPMMNINLNADGFVGATVRDNRYVVMVKDTTSNQYALETIGDDGRMTAVSLPSNLPNRYDAAYQAAAFGPNSILLAAGSGYFVMGYDGTIIKEPTTVANKSAPTSMVAAWDGHEFLLAFSSLEAVRVAADGTLIDSSTFPLSGHTSNSMTVASSGTAKLVAWNDMAVFTGGLVARVAANFDALAANSTDPPTHVAYMGEAQFQPQIAQSPTGLFAAWSDPGRYEVSASFNGSPITIDETEADDWVGWPAVGAGNRVFLVVWWHNTKNEKDRLVAQRFDFAGQPLDLHPVVLDESPFYGSQLNHTASSIVFDGSTFFVAWTRNPGSYPTPEDLHAIRIGEDGQPFGAQAVAVTNVQGYYYSQGARSARALWTGSDYLVVTTFNVSGHAGGLFDYRYMSTVRFDATNTTVSQTPTQMFGNTTLATYPAAITRLGSRITYAWADDMNGISVAQATLGGVPVIAPRAIVRRAWTEPPTLAGITWNGSEHVLVWLDTMAPDSRATKLRGMRLDANLEPIDSEPFDVFSGPGPLSIPWLVSTPTGVSIAYSRTDAANGDQLRVFVRTLDRLNPEVSHRRAAGH
jgi:hypothetical protein